MTRDIVFEDDNVRVIYKSGTSNQLLVTFADLVTPLDGERFFADVPAEKLGMAAIGFVAKAGNWFPAASITAAVAAIRPLLGRFASIIAYGGSMGGYGAIKYSRLLGADMVIAFCPQWSLDAAECGFDPGWQSLYRPSMAGMGIRPDDVAGRIFLFVDKMHPLDRHHARKIEQAAANLQIINFPSVGHHVTTVAAGTDNLMNLIAACRTQDMGGLRQIVRACRRWHKYRLETLVRKVLQRYPALLYAGICRWAGTDGFRNARMSPDLLDMLAACCRRFGDRQREALVLAQRYRVEWNVQNQLGLALQHAVLTGEPVGMKTHHGTCLFYDLDTRTVRHGAADATGRHVPLAYHVQNGLIRFQARVERLTLDLSVVTDGPAAGLLQLSGDGMAGEMLPAGPGGFALRFGGHYLSAEPNGTVVANRSGVQGWERFCFLP